MEKEGKEDEGDGGAKGGSNKNRNNYHILGPLQLQVLRCAVNDAKEWRKLAEGQSPTKRLITYKVTSYPVHPLRLSISYQNPLILLYPIETAYRPYRPYP